MGLFDIFSGGKNPADAAMPYLNKIEPMEHENYDPYIEKGNQAYNDFAPQLSKMTQDPAAFLEQLMGYYQPSRGYQLKRDEALRAAGNTAAAGGMRGSLSDIENESRLADYLQGEDMQQWLQNILGIQGQGIQGQTHLFDTGYNATQNLTGDLSNLFGTQGQLAFQGQAQKNASQSDLLSGLAKAIGAIGGFQLPGKNAGTIGGSIYSKFF